MPRHGDVGQVAEDEGKGGAVVQSLPGLFRAHGVAPEAAPEEDTDVEQYEGPTEMRDLASRRDGIKGADQWRESGAGQAPKKLA